MSEDFVLDNKDELQEMIYSFPYHHVVQYFPHFFQCFNDGWGINYASTLEFLLARLESERSVQAIMDFGCGDGRLTKEIRSRFPHYHVDGVDYSERAIRFARAFDPQGFFQVKDLVRAEPESIKYDVGMLVEVFEHIKASDADEALRYIYESMSEGGVLYVTVPHVNDPLHDRHYRHFNSESIRASLCAFFEVTEIVFIEKRSIKKQAINFILQNNYFILNHKRILDKLYAYYKEKLFFAEESTCNRMYVRCLKK